MFAIHLMNFPRNSCKHFGYVEEYLGGSYTANGLKLCNKRKSEFSLIK